MKQLVTLLFSGVFLSMVSIGCDSTEPATQSEESKVISNIGNNIILDIYENLEADSDPLLTAVKALRSSQTQANLDAARAKWLNARVSFELAEAFEWGPIKTTGLKPKIDFWPADENEIALIIAGSTTIDQAYVDSRPNGAKGYHAMEFILWGNDPKNPRQPNTFVARELEYLEALALDHKNLANALHEEWASNGGNFIGKFTRTLSGDNTYVSDSASLYEVVEGLAHICEEVEDEYLGGPYNASDPRLLESYYSNSSGSDFYNILTGVQKVYTGVHGSSSDLGVSYLVRPLASGLDDSVRAQITDCLAKLQVIKDDCNDAVVSPTGRPNTSAAIQSAKELTRLFDDRVKPVLFGN
jgi:predicted lipoprotein